MRVIENNPFKVLGLLATASERELTSAVRKSSRFVDTGKKIDFDYDFEFFNNFTRTVSDIEVAKNALDRQEDRLLHALFWFTKNNTSDGLSLSYLKAGNVQGAIEVLEKNTSNREITEKNITSLSNLATIQMCSNVLEIQKQGIANKIAVIRSSCFPYFVELVTDKNFHVESEAFINTFLEAFSDVENVSELFQLVPSDIRENIATKLIADNVFAIERCIEKLLTVEDKFVDAHVERFLEEIRPLYDEVETVLGGNNIKFISISDKIADALLEMHCRYYHENVNKVENEMLHATTRNILDQGVAFAAGESLKDKYKESVDSLIGTIKHSNLKHFYDAFHSDFEKYNEMPIESSISLIASSLFTLENQVGEEDEMYLLISEWTVSSSVADCLQKAIDCTETQQGDDKLILDELKSCVEIMETIACFKMTDETREMFNNNLESLKSNVFQLERRVKGSESPSVGWIFWLAFFVFLCIARS